MMNDSSALEHMTANIEDEVDAVSMATLEEKGKNVARLALATKAIDMVYLVAQTMIAWQIAAWTSHPIDYLQALLIANSINFLNWASGTIVWDLLGLRNREIRKMVVSCRDHGAASVTVRGLVMFRMKMQEKERKAEVTANTMTMVLWGVAYIAVAGWTLLAA